MPEELFGEARLPLLWTLGVEAGHLTIPQFLRAWSSRPAETRNLTG